MIKRVAKVIYLIQEASQKICIQGFIGGRGHWCMAIDNVETYQAFMLLLPVVRLRSFLISY